MAYYRRYFTRSEVTQLSRLVLQSDLLPHFTYVNKIIEQIDAGGIVFSPWAWYGTDERALEALNIGGGEEPKRCPHCGAELGRRTECPK